jgi:hypothetical protein
LGGRLVDEKKMNLPSVTNQLSCEMPSFIYQVQPPPPTDALKVIYDLKFCVLPARAGNWTHTKI